MPIALPTAVWFTADEKIPDGNTGAAREKQSSFAKLLCAVSELRDLIVAQRGGNSRQRVVVQ